MRLHVSSWLLVGLLALPLGVFAQSDGNYNTNSFKQLKEELPTPNVYRTASGAPGHEYYQQKADYVMDIKLDDARQIISDWRVHYNRVRPHSSLGYTPPEKYAQQAA